MIKEKLFGKCSYTTVEERKFCYASGNQVFNFQLCLLFYIVSLCASLDGDTDHLVTFLIFSVKGTLS